MNNLFFRKKIIIVGAVLLAAIICTIIIIYQLSQTSRNEPLTIKNINNYPIKNDATYITSNIYSQVIRPLMGGVKNPRHTASIRSSSFKAQNNKPTGTVSFMLDVETLERSWKINLHYTDTGKLKPSGVVSSCPTSADRIYIGDINCQDWSMNTPSAEFYNNDILAQKTPYSNQFFSIHTSPQDDKNIFVAIKLFEANSINTSDKAKEDYRILKEKSLKWIRDTGANPNDYIIEWRDYKGRPMERNRGTPGSSEL